MNRLLPILPLLALCGCAIPSGNIDAEKETVFGVEIAYDAASTSPRVRIGLIRRFHQRVPCSTNRIYAPDYATSMSAEIKPLSQTVREDFGTGLGAGVVTNANTAAKSFMP